MKQNSICIRRLKESEIPAAHELAWRVFNEYEAPDYGEQGTESFRHALHDQEYLAGMEYIGAFDQEKLVGEIALKPERKHICFFFVDGAYHRRGIGTAMLRYLLEQYPDGTITLNSSPYGLPFYKAVGFRETDRTQTVDSITFTPMAYFSEQKR